MDQIQIKLNECLKDIERTAIDLQQCADDEMRIEAQRIRNKYSKKAMYEDMATLLSRVISLYHRSMETKNAES